MIDLQTLRDKLRQKSSSIQEITLGHSESQVFIVQDKEKLVLKCQELGVSPSLRQEADNIIWLKGKLPVPEILYYEIKEGKEWLLMSFVAGKPSFAHTERKKIGEILGSQLKIIHALPYSDFPHQENQTILLQKKYELIHPDQNYSYPDTWTPVFSHGDYCLPNILIQENGKSSFIDLGSAGIYDLYHDLYLGSWSLAYNTLADQIPAFLRLMD